MRNQIDRTRTTFGNVFPSLSRTVNAIPKVQDAIDEVKHLEKRGREYCLQRNILFKASASKRLQQISSRVMKVILGTVVMARMISSSVFRQVTSCDSHVRIFYFCPGQN